MLSDPYLTKGTARSAAKLHAEQNGLTTFTLMVDLENRQYHFSDEEIKPGCKMIVFGRYKLSRGKWLEKPLLREKSRKGA